MNKVDLIIGIIDAIVVFALIGWLIYFTIECNRINRYKPELDPRTLKKRIDHIEWYQNAINNNTEIRIRNLEGKDQHKKPFSCPEEFTYIGINPVGEYVFKRKTND